MTRTVIDPQVTPSWIGGSADRGRDGDRLYRRHDPLDAAFLSTPGAIAALMRAAADIAAPVLAADATEIVLAELPGRPAKLDDLLDSALLRRAVGARTAVHALDVSEELEQRSLIADLERMLAAFAAAEVPVPVGVTALLPRLQPFFDTVDRFRMPAVPCHSDGAVSNLLLDPAGGVTLTGWSLAARRDPLEEAGSLIGELTPWISSPGELLQLLHLPTDAILVAHAWSIADDLLWTLIAHWRASHSTDPSIDSVKYGLWRLARARATLAASAELDSWLENPR